MEQLESKHEAQCTKAYVGKLSLHSTPQKTTTLQSPPDHAHHSSSVCSEHTQTDHVVTGLAGPAQARPSQPASINRRHAKKRGKQCPHAAYTMRRRLVFPGPPPPPPPAFPIGKPGVKRATGQHRRPRRVFCRKRGGAWRGWNAPVHRDFAAPPPPWRVNKFSAARNNPVSTIDGLAGPVPAEGVLVGFAYLAYLLSSYSGPRASSRLISTCRFLIPCCPRSFSSSVCTFACLPVPSLDPRLSTPTPSNTLAHKSTQDESRSHQPRLDACRHASVQKARL